MFEWLVEGGLLGVMVSCALGYVVIRVAVQDAIRAERRKIKPPE
ncbi:MAG: hypothetical protein V9E81_02520 [Marmoricola sp.]